MSAPFLNCTSVGKLVQLDVYNTHASLQYKKKKYRDMTHAARRANTGGGVGGRASCAGGVYIYITPIPHKNIFFSISHEAKWLS